LAARQKTLVAKHPDTKQAKRQVEDLEQPQPALFERQEEALAGQRSAELQFGPHLFVNPRAGLKFGVPGCGGLFSLKGYG
jgi:hypothetical protein